MIIWVKCLHLKLTGRGRKENPTEIDKDHLRDSTL
jgi:hypothetical protein